MQKLHLAMLCTVVELVFAKQTVYMKIVSKTMWWQMLSTVYMILLICHCRESSCNSTCQL